MSAARRVTAALATLAIGASIGVGAAVAAPLPTDVSATVSTEVGGLAIPAKAAPAVKVGNTLIASCVIRFDHADGKTPTMLGGSHACVGVEKVQIRPTNGDLTLTLAVKDTRKWKITAPFVGPDEQLAGVVTTGISGGTGVAHVRFHTLDGKRLDLRKAADRKVIWGGSKNIWYRSEWIDSATFTNGGQ